MIETKKKGKKSIWYTDKIFKSDENNVRLSLFAPTHRKMLSPRTIHREFKWAIIPSKDGVNLYAQHKFDLVMSQMT